MRHRNSDGKQYRRATAWMLMICILLAACMPGCGNTASKNTVAAAEAAAPEKEAAAPEKEAAAPEAEAGQADAAADQTAGKKVYFAGPLFNDAEREYNLKLVTILESYGYEVFLPQRDGYLAPELEGKTEEEITEMIFQKDRDEVLASDIIFMVLDGRIPDEGACVELGIAYASGKRCYGIKNDARAVELNMDLNPMITGCFSKLFYNLDGEELIKELEEYLKNNQL